MREYHTPKAMKSVGDLFEKYKTRFKAPQASVEKACAEAINEVTGFKVTQAQVTYTVATKTISLQVPSVLKSELKFHHAAIMERLERELGRDGCPKVIL